MAGDRRATMGNLIANRDMEKVFAADEYAAVGIAGTAGLAIELVKLFQVELEHYEKIEGTLMSARGQGEPARQDDPRPTWAWPCRASRSCRSSPGTTSTAATRPDLLLRRDRRLLRGARPPQRRVGLAVRARVDEEALAPGPRRATRPCGWRSRRSTTPPTTTPPPAVRTSAGGSGRRSPSSTPRGCGSSPTSSSPPVVEQVVDRTAAATRGGAR